MQNEKNGQNDHAVIVEKRPYVRPELTNHGKVEVATMQVIGPSQQST